ncbi:probable G-protein coupled receptor Mth-like 4 [Neocloeon triangulifer]|uniref:probable G-protein coupled receptor Mth-like 4 n=1 Tax=Neocloeon triangulifer TaxID=2078957 RepID=UPI00286EDBB3|nr:probable G-protein coupled receptor Mth-like 4 [Neocloeon triangulifer]
MKPSLPKIANFTGFYFLFLVTFGKCEQICRDGEPQLRISKADVEVKDGIILYENHAFKPGDYEVVGDFYVICPCNVKYCVKTCTDLENGEYFPPDKNFKVDVLTKDGQTKTVDFYSHFYPFIDTRDCNNNWEDITENDYVLLENGSLAHSLHQDLYLEYKYSGYCFAQDNEGESKKIVCVADITDSEGSGIFYINLIHILTAFSAIFLLITAIAIVASKERKSNLGKLAVCFSLTNVVSYLIFIYYYFVKPENFTYSKGICNILAITVYVSKLSSYFWLNSMCFENFRLSKCSREPETSRFFIFSSLYSTLMPFIVILIFWEPSHVLWYFFKVDFNVSINEITCYIQDIAMELIVLHCPIFIVSISSLIILVATLIRHLNLGRDKDFSWFAICVLLFIIMVIPVIVDCGVFLLMNESDTSIVAIILYNLSSLCGILVFLVFFTFNENFRKSLFCCRKAAQPYNEAELR